MARAFVTGASGLVGAWLVRALLERGDDVTALRRAPTWLAADVRVVDGDLLGEPSVPTGTDVVFHLAAQPIVSVAREDPVLTWEMNVGGTWRVLAAAHAASAGRVIVAGSDKAATPRSPYDASKAAVEIAVGSWRRFHDLAASVLRLPNVYGGGDRHRSRLVPEAVTAVLAGRRPVIRSDGTPQRSFLYVEDAASAYLAASAAPPEEWDAGPDSPTSVREVVDTVCRLAGNDLEPEVLGLPTDQPAVLRTDSSAFREATGWAPTVNLEEGLRRTLEWYGAHPEAVA